MAIKKSEIYSSLWKACDELRGGIEPALYKDYILTLLFLKYISDKYADQEYAEIKIPEGSSFKDLVNLKGLPDIGDQINKLIRPIEEANDIGNFPDFNDSQKLGSGKAMQDRLTNLISIFEKKELDFSANRAGDDDILGDAYEYLMRNFASESGKSKGQFYTPSEVSRVIALVLGIANVSTSGSTTVYDPTCGSGSLLLKVANESINEISLYGQEEDTGTVVLAQMNMIIHNNPTALICQGDTIVDPQFIENANLKTFDYVVANPPFSDKRWANGIIPEQDKFERFQPFGIPPAKQGDYAYMLHIIRSLKSNGKGAVILPLGVLFRGNVEETIRKNILNRGYIKAIIGLPPNLFFGTGIPACIIILEKSEASARDSVFMINASEGFIKDGPKNRLREMDIRRIVDAYKQGDDITGYARLVSMEEIIKQDYNLNISRYIQSHKTEDIQDIEAHLNGGIPESDIDVLSDYWRVFGNLKDVLFKNNRQGYLSFNVSINLLNEKILNHSDYTTFKTKTEKHFDVWSVKLSDSLKMLQKGINPKEEIKNLSGDLFSHYTKQPLINPYDIYQLIMDYWEDVLADDFHLIAANGWSAKPHRIFKKIKQGSKKGQEKDVGWDCDLLPKNLLISHTFLDKRLELNKRYDKLQMAEAYLHKMLEEQSLENGVFADFDKVNVKEVNARIKEIRGSYEFADELSVLNDWSNKTKAIAALKKQIKEQEEVLDKEVLKYYTNLTEPEIKEIVVHKKWLTSLKIMIADAYQEVLESLIERLKDLAERYEIPLPQLKKQTNELSSKVESHLETMGFSWK